MVVKKSAVITALLLATPAVFALNTGISPLDSTFNLLGRIFNITAFQNEQAALGLARLAWLIIVFAVLHWSGTKVFANGGNSHLNKRVSVIVSLVLAILSAFLIPSNVVLALFSGYTIIFGSILILLPTIIALTIGFKGIGQEQGENKPRTSYFLEALVIGMGGAWLAFMEQTLLVWINDTFPESAAVMYSFVDIMFAVIVIAVFVKLAQAIGGPIGRGVGGALGDAWRWNSDRRDRNRAREPHELVPQAPINLDGELLPGLLSHGSEEERRAEPTHISLWWDANPEDEHVRRYQVYYKKNGRRAALWNKLASVTSAPTRESPFRILLPKKSLKKDSDGSFVSIGVCAVNAKGESSVATKFIFQKTTKLYFATEANRLREDIRNFRNFQMRTNALRSAVRTRGVRGLGAAERNELLNVMNTYPELSSEIERMFNAIYQNSAWRDCSRFERSEILILFRDFVSINTFILTNLRFIEVRL